MADGSLLKNPNDDGLEDGDDRPGNRKRKNPGDLEFVDDYFEVEDTDDGEIKVNTIDGKIITLKVKGSDTIGNMKVKIQAEEHVPFNQQELIFNHVILEDTTTLADLRIKKECTIKLMRKSSGLINVFMKRFPCGRSESLEVKPSDTIANVKAKIPCCYTGQMLMFNDIVLGDSGTIDDFNITDKSTLYLICKSEGMMEIFVNTFTKKTLTLWVKPTYTVAQVKSQIQREECISYDEQVLIFNEMVLGDTGVLYDFHIKGKSTLTLMPKSRGFTGFVKIFIKTLTGKTITKEVKPSDTVKSIKAKIQGKVDIPGDEQELIFNEMVLHDKDTIAECNITRESTLTVMRVSTGYMHIFVKSVASGETITLEVKPSDTIYHVKTLIHDKEGFPPSEQRLHFGSIRLDDSPTLADYKIHSESVLCYIPR